MSICSKLHFQPILNKKHRQLGGFETQQNQFIAQSNKVGRNNTCNICLSNIGRENAEAQYVKPVTYMVKYSIKLHEKNQKSFETSPITR